MRSTPVRLSIATTAVLGIGLLSGSVAGSASAAPTADPVADPAGVIDLPPGYSYDIVAEDCVDEVTSTESGETFPMPGDFDNNVLLRGRRGRVQLLSAHELTQPRDGDYQGDAGKCAVPEQATEDDGDSDGWGSVTRLTLGRDGTTVEKSEVITTGLHNLCAGTRTPWGTFLVNEEYPFVDDADHRSGWVWEIDPKTGEATQATGMGRFSHEQEARSKGAWYLTNDYFLNSSYQYLYKFVPDHARDLTSGDLYGLVWDHTSNTGEWVGPLDEQAPDADMASRVGPPTAENTFQKHEGIVKAKKGHGLVFAESGSGENPGRIWELKDGRRGMTGKVLVEGDTAQMSAPDNVEFDPKGNLFIFEDGGLGDNEVYVLPKGKTGAENLHLFATIRGGGEGTGPVFSRNGKRLYLSIQDQEMANGSESRVIAIRMRR